MSKDIIIFPSGDTTNSNPFIRFSGGTDMNYIMEITDDGYVDLSVEENIVTSGLTLYLDAGNYESYSGGTTWYDLSGNNYDGTLTNGPVYNDGSIVFDGVDDIVYGPSSVLWFTNTSFSIDAWVKPETTPPSQQVWFAAVGPNGGTQRNLHLRIYSNGSIRFGFYSNDLNSATNIVNFGQWNHIICTYDYSADTSKIYYNGSEVASSSVGPFIDINANVFIGNWGGISQPFKGDISLTKVYDRALSASEITQNYNATKHRFGL